MIFGELDFKVMLVTSIYNTYRPKNSRSVVGLSQNYYLWTLVLLALNPRFETEYERKEKKKKENMKGEREQGGKKSKLELF